MTQPRFSRTVLAAFVGAAFTFSSVAQSADKDMPMRGGMGGPSMEMHQMMVKDSKEMMGMKPSGDVDRDFAVMMRHHHQSGVRMAEHELKHGKDKKMREMAQKIMESQKKEIAEFDEWLKANPARSAAK